MKKKSSAPEYFTDSEGRRLVRLQVHGSEAPAITAADLYDNAIHRYGLTGTLYMSGDGKGNRYVVATIPGTGSHSPIARLLLDRPKGYRVRYYDGDPLNLLPENFRLDAPWADESTAARALALHLDNAQHESHHSQRRQA